MAIETMREPRAEEKKVEAGVLAASLPRRGRRNAGERGADFRKERGVETAPMRYCLGGLHEMSWGRRKIGESVLLSR
ncbi:MAG: hypothetical protein D6795_16890 [Deltaproteobacteria bacterium]|nr:MAG: hypothetical protein D6795_16890 [Deltaproteobacteria bacterium]